MSHSDYEVISYRPELKPQLCELHRHLWGKDMAVNAAQFEWKYERNPYLPEPIVSLALHKGTIVAMRGIFGSRWETGEGGSPQTLPFTADTVIHPDHRNAGLLPQIARHTLRQLADRGYEYVFNGSSIPATFFASLTVGWRCAGPMDPVELGAPPPSRSTLQKARDLAKKSTALVSVVRALRPRKSATSGATRLPSGVLFRNLDKNAPAANDIRLSRAPEPEAMSELIQRLGPETRLRHVRDRAYFAWRFQSPRCAYRFLYSGKDKLDGYLVIQTAAVSGEPVARVVDWEGADDAVLRRLLRSAVEWGRFPRLIAWTGTCKPNARAILKELGFAVSPKRTGVLAKVPGLLVRSVSDEGLSQKNWSLTGRDLLDLDNWQMQMIFTDAV